jgi:imidazolonepropionase-like amidohydrolase
MIRDSDCWYVPTLLRMYLGVYVGPNVGASEWLNRKFKEVWVAHQEAVLLAHEEGCKIGLGTDLGLRPHTRHGINAQELRLLVQCGLSPLEAIASGTSIAAAAMGKGKRIGTVEAGKIADLIAVSGDPTQKIESLESVGFVMKGGKIFKDCLTRTGCRPT